MALYAKYSDRVEVAGYSYLFWLRACAKLVLLLAEDCEAGRDGGFWRSQVEGIEFYYCRPSCWLSTVGD
jgi:hypothetical protein